MVWKCGKLPPLSKIAKGLILTSQRLSTVYEHVGSIWVIFIPKQTFTGQNGNNGATGSRSATVIDALNTLNMFSPFVFRLLNKDNLNK